MMDFLNFTFASFWHFAGMVFLVSAVTGGGASVFRSIFVRTGWSLIEPKIRKTIVDAIREARAP